jgi:hypothetical protein
MSVATFATHLYSTGVSTNIREISWIIPTVQSVHILSIAALIGSALVMDLRLAGVLATDETPYAVVKRHLHWLWIALGVLLTSGIVLIVGEPYRELTNPVFWIKMGLVLTAFCLTLLFRYPILHPKFSEEHWRLAILVKPMAWASMAVWVAIIFCGRWIAYLQ